MSLPNVSGDEVSCRNRLRYGNVSHSSVSHSVRPSHLSRCGQFAKPRVAGFVERRPRREGLGRALARVRLQYYVRCLAARATVSLPASRGVHMHLRLVLLTFVVTMLAGRAVAQTAEQAYHVKPGDVLQISVWGEPELQGPALVGPDGTF